MRRKPNNVSKFLQWEVKSVKNQLQQKSRMKNAKFSDNNLTKRFISFYGMSRLIVKTNFNSLKNACIKALYLSNNQSFSRHKTIHPFSVNLAFKLLVI